MTDILYVWKDGATSVGMSSEVQLPQFRVLGHRQRSTVVSLTTGTCTVLYCTVLTTACSTAFPKSAPPRPPPRSAPRGSRHVPVPSRPPARCPP